MVFDMLEMEHEGLRFTARSLGEGPLVLLLHGFPDDNHSFDLQMQVLAEAGYRAVAPVMRGYEVSSQSSKNLYHLTHLAGDIFAWMEHLNVQQCHLVGHDWGALAAYVATVLQPRKVKSLSTLAIPHLRRALQGVVGVPGQLLKSSYILLMQLPKVSELLVGRSDYAFVEQLWKRWSPDWQYSEAELEQVKSTFRQPGVVQAATQYYRCLLSPLSLSSQQSWRLLTSRIDAPTLALTGVNDGCMDSRLYEKVMREQDFESGLSVERIEGTGHFLHREKPDEVNALLLDWIRQHA